MSIHKTFPPTQPYSKLFEVGEIILILQLKCFRLVEVNFLKVAVCPYIIVPWMCYLFCQPVASKFHLETS